MDEVKPAGRLPRSNIGSRVNREVHARFWERPEVRNSSGRLDNRVVSINGTSLLRSDNPLGLLPLNLDWTTLGSRMGHAGLFISRDARLHNDACPLNSAR